MYFILRTKNYVRFSTSVKTRLIYWQAEMHFSRPNCLGRTAFYVVLADELRLELSFSRRKVQLLYLWAEVVVRFLELIPMSLHTYSLEGVNH